jgi:archaellum biogenesis ATPase FlaH
MYATKGINLVSAHAKGHFSFINGLSAPYEWTEPVNELDENTSFSSIGNAHLFSFNTKSPEKSLKQLYEMIKKTIEHKRELCSHCVIIDNLNYLGIGCKNYLQVLDFIQYLIQLVEYQKVL